ncbi:MAG: glycosyltransferase [Ketobacteraceae bacterium]|nr:glycosyltransferase [Ketobacteraceae bacterium]
MKILSVHDYPPHVLGGAESQAARLVTEWLRMGHSVKSASHRTPGGWLPLEEMAVHVHHINAASNSRPVRALKYSTRLAAWLTRQARGADILYFRFLGEGALTAVVLKALGLIRLPVVACPGCFGKSGDAAIIQSLPAWRRLVPLINRHCNAINILAAPIARELEAMGINPDLFVSIPNGIPVGAAPPPAANEKVRLLFAGRCEPAKGLDYLIEAWAALTDNEREGMSLTIAGDGSVRDVLQRQAETLGVATSVSFPGRINNREMRQLIASHDILVLPSLEEGFSNVALEALECARPVAVTTLGGIDQYISADMGWTMPPGDVSAITKVLRDIHAKSHGDLTTMGNLARQLAEQQFDIRKTAEQHIALFQQLLNNQQAIKN